MNEWWKYERGKKGMKALKVDGRGVDKREESERKEKMNERWKSERKRRKYSSKIQQLGRVRGIMG